MLDFFLLDVLTDKVNTYLNLQTLGILWTVNNRPVRSIREMIQIIGDLIQEGKDQAFENFILFGMGGLRNGNLEKAVAKMEDDDCACARRLDLG